MKIAIFFFILCLFLGEIPHIILLFIKRVVLWRTNDINFNYTHPAQRAEYKNTLTKSIRTHFIILIVSGLFIIHTLLGFL